VARKNNYPIVMFRDMTPSAWATNDDKKTLYHRAFFALVLTQFC
jgi:hypothetical protein